jgi:hypothetical protein
MTRKPLELKSPDNAMALGAYLLTAVLGGAFVIGKASSPGLTLLLSDPWVPAWGLLMVLSGLTALTAAMTCSHSLSPVRWLKAERFATVGVCVSWAIYAYGTQAVPAHTSVGLILFGLQAAQAGWRFEQLSVELRHIRQAIEKPTVVIVESLADPRDIP